jgi:O-antigen/teichoic acid export membrane protein
MKRDLTDYCDEIEVTNGRSLASISMRIKALEERFPSASQGLLSIFDQGVVSATAFLTAAIVGRLTSPDQLGLYYLVLSIVILVSGVQDAAIGGPYMVLSKRRHGQELAEYSGSMWVHQFVLTALTFCMLCIAIAGFWAAGNTTIMPGLLALLGAGPLILLRDGVRRFAFANLEVKAVIALDIAVSVVQLGGLLLLGYFGKLSVLSIYAVMAGACTLACLGWYLLDTPHLSFRRQKLLPDWLHNWAFGKWALWSYAMSGTMPAVMLWILGLAIEPAATAMLGVCTTLIGMSNVIVSGVSNVLTPMAAKAYAAGGGVELRRILSLAAAFIGLTIGSVCLGALAFGNWLVVLVFGNHYQGAGLIPFILAVSALMTGMQMVAGNGLWAIHKPRSAFVADASGMFVTLIAAATLIFPLGVLGAALAILGGSTTAATMRIVILIRNMAADGASHGLPATPTFCPDGTM